jgi:hypothetical protein
MKVKHNKKRNTAFLFEALVREVTKSVVKNDKKRTRAAKSILAEHFNKGSVLYEELDCYNSVLAKQGVNKDTAEKLLSVARETYDKIDHQEIFNEQSKVIKKINTNLDRSVYNNFVPNYRSFATIAQLFGDKASVKNRVLMEQAIVEDMMNEQEQKQSLKPVDSLVVNSFSERFNKEYSHLLEEQKQLLGKYIVSIGQNAVDFRIHVGNELKRIKEEVERSLELEEVKQDEEMIAATRQVLEQINSMNVANLGDKEILKVLKLQKLAKEYQSNDN